MQSAIAKIQHTLEMVKFSHTIFALPFALASMLVAASGLPSGRELALILAAMVTARNCAMAFNRFADADLDANNVRTKDRHLPKGILSKSYALIFSITNAALLVLVAYLLNPLCFILSFPALVVLFGYSYCKRFTHYSHLVLGLALGCAPVGAWIAITGNLPWAPIVLGIAVIFWVAGFDTIYATMDFEFDLKTNLKSLLTRFGLKKGLAFAKAFHLVALHLLLIFGFMTGMHYTYYIGVSLIGIILIIEHAIISPKDLSRVNMAFFNFNGGVSILYLASIISCLI